MSVATRLAVTVVVGELSSVVVWVGVELESVGSASPAVGVGAEASLLLLELPELLPESLDLGTFNALVAPATDEVSVTELNRVQRPFEMVTPTQASKLSQDAMQSWSETARLTTLLNRLVTVWRTSPVKAVSQLISKLLLGASV